MPRPTIDPNQIKTPEFTSPISGSSEPCGQTYKRQVSVSQPYRGISSNAFELQPLLPSNFEWDSEATRNALNAAIENVEQTLSGSNPAVPFGFYFASNQSDAPQGQSGGQGFATETPQGVLIVNDNQNRDRLVTMINQAKAYSALAGELETYWSQEYTPRGEPMSQPVHWPLGTAKLDQYPYCEGKGFGAAVTSQFTTLYCPTEAEVFAHEDDELKRRNLIRAAVFWTRCAQEALLVVASHYLNKREYEQSVPEGQFPLAPLPAPTIPPSQPAGPLPTPGFDEPLPTPGLDEPLPGADDTGGGGIVDSADQAIDRAKSGWAGLSTPAKAALVLGGGFVLYKLAKR